MRMQLETNMTNLTFVSSVHCLVVTFSCSNLKVAICSSEKLCFIRFLYTLFFLLDHFHNIFICAVGLCKLLKLYPDFMLKNIASFTTSVLILP